MRRRWPATARPAKVGSLCGGVRACKLERLVREGDGSERQTLQKPQPLNQSTVGVMSGAGQGERGTDLRHW